MRYHWKIAGEFAGPDRQTNMMFAGDFSTLGMALRAVKAAVDFAEDPKPGKVPDDVVQLMSLVEPESLQVILFRKDFKGGENAVMVFDGNGHPIMAEADEVWPLVKKGLEELR